MVSAYRRYRPSSITDETCEDTRTLSGILNAHGCSEWAGNSISVSSPLSTGSSTTPLPGTSSQLSTHRVLPDVGTPVGQHALDISANFSSPLVGQYLWCGTHWYFCELDPLWGHSSPDIQVLSHLYRRSDGLEGNGHLRTPAGDPRFNYDNAYVVRYAHMSFSSFLTPASYYYLITYYFQPTVLLVGVWSMNAIPAVSGVTIAVTQSFFARRVYIFGPRYRAVVAVVVVLTICELGFFVAATVETFEVEDYESFKHVTWLISTAAAISLAEDVLLTTVLIYALCRSRKGIKRTNAMIDVMIMYTINTGFLTSVFNFLYMFFSLSRPDDMVYIGIGITALKIYSNSLMAALNSREALKAKISGVYIETSHPGLDGQSESPTVLRGVHVEASANTASSFESVVLELSAKPQLLAVPYTAENRENALHNSAQSG